MNMNCSVYLFGELGEGYTQFPLDNSSKKILSTFYDRGQADAKLTFVREGKLAYYGYTRPLQGGHFIGICCLFNDVLCTDIEKIFGVFEAEIQQMANDEDFLRQTSYGEIIPESKYFNHKVVERISKRIRSRFSDNDVSFMKMPVVRYSIDSSDIRSYRYGDDAQIIIRSMMEYKSVCVTKEIAKCSPAPQQTSSNSYSRNPISWEIASRISGFREIAEQIWGALVSLSCIAFYVFIFFNAWHVRTRISDYVTENILEINPRYKAIYVDGKRFTMRLVEGGIFMMGAPEQDTMAKWWEKPAHKVTLDSYYIGKTEVTQKLWEKVMGDNPNKDVGKKYPVTCVSWDDCVKFCDKLSQMTGRKFRLPTEAEWEFAARGGNKSRGYEFSGGDNLDKVAWYMSNCENSVHKVRKKKSNELGLFDMSGNVSEICSDWYEQYSKEEEMNPRGPENSEKGIVFRGGNWCNNQRYCRVTYRYHTPKDECNNMVGFRLVMELPVEESEPDFFAKLWDFPYKVWDFIIWWK